MWPARSDRDGWMYVTLVKGFPVLEEIHESKWAAGAWRIEGIFAIHLSEGIRSRVEEWMRSTCVGWCVDGQEDPEDTQLRSNKAHRSAQG